MRPELHAFSRIEHAGAAAATPATLVASIGVGVDIDRRRGLHRRTGSRIGDVAGQSRNRRRRRWIRNQSDGSADADVATRAIPGGSGCQRSRRDDVARPSFADKRSQLVVVVALPAPANVVALKDEHVAIEEPAAARRSIVVVTQYVHLGNGRHVQIKNRRRGRRRRRELLLDVQFVQQLGRGRGLRATSS